MARDTHDIGILFEYCQLDVWDLRRKKDTSNDTRESGTNNSHSQLSWFINVAVHERDFREMIFMLCRCRVCLRFSQKRLNDVLDIINRSSLNAFRRNPFCRHCGCRSIHEMSWRRFSQLWNDKMKLYDCTCFIANQAGLSLISNSEPDRGNCDTMRASMPILWSGGFALSLMACSPH